MGIIYLDFLQICIIDDPDWKPEDEYKEETTPKNKTEVKEEDTPTSAETTPKVTAGKSQKKTKSKGSKQAKKEQLREQKVKAFKLFSILWEY